MITKKLLFMAVFNILFIAGCTKEILYDNIDVADIDDLSQKIEVTDFQSCTRVVGIVLESHPRQCQYNGVTYTEEILYDNTEPPQKIDDLESPPITLYFTLANERSPDRTVKVVLNGRTVYDGELKFGFGTFKKINFEATKGTFSFDVTDLKNGKKESTIINTENGSYFTVSFWGDSINVNQSTEEQIRYD